MIDSTVVEASGLNVTRSGRHILKDLSLDLKAGSITGLIGPSGCGKTTLMRAIVGVQQFDGTLSVLGQTPGDPQVRGKVGYVTQAASIYDDLTVAQNLDYFATLAGVARDGGIEKRLGLADHAHQKVSDLSGGQRGRASLGCALVGNPQLLVMDEPTVGLDPVTRESLWAQFRQLAAGGATLLVSSHVLEEAARCDNLLVMREGRFLWRGSPDELLSRTQTSTFDEAFLAIIDAETTGEDAK